MKYFISSVLCCIFFLEISSWRINCLKSKSKSKNNKECESSSADWKDQIPMDWENELPPLISHKSENEIPAWILRWKSREYGLEFQGTPTVVTNIKKELSNREEYALIDDSAYGKAVQDTMKSRINVNNDFTIVQMDPIEFEYDRKKMWLLLENIKLENLNSYDELSFFHQLPIIEKREHKIPKKIFDDVENKNKREHKPLDKKKYRINEDDFIYFNRRDDSWKINLVAYFVNDEKKVTMEADFKIQPNPEQGEGFRQKGTVILEFNKFYFDIEFVIKHIDVLLIDFLDERIKCNNRVPNFNVDYHFSGIKIKKVTVEGYDEDIIEWQIPEQPPDVNPDSEPSEEEMRVKIKKAEEKVKQNNLEGDVLDIAKKHLNIVINFIMKEKNIVKKKLRANIMPKITWKMMKMKTKQQLPSLLHEVVKYEKHFNPRSKLSDVEDTAMKDGIELMAKATLNKFNPSASSSLKIEENRHKLLEQILKAKDSD